ncbi:dsDNA nuclease domain-containing protein [Caballeronia sp. INDeC2]|uniref:dsDNA nuclease domain-containing protein n=1 Tax=Caballeronia sp. INDeC2 TaxID=2921747 RepID=UPI00202942D2|nr:dsDNA nuclease domain-containing protein [Caballeronia sp. INDeC2]
MRDLASDEKTGVNASLGFTYQHWYAALLAIERLGVMDDYLIILEFKEDVAIVDSPEQPSRAEFHQVKKNEQSGIWTLRDLLATLGRHPLSLLRPTLLEQRLVPASTLMTYPNGRLARGCGLVTVRQRPGTAKGVMFVTLEDETGNVNVIVWPSLLEKFRREALGAALLAVYGTWQCEGEVRHLIAQRLVDMSHLLGGLTTVSRNFC